jgi:hypothetical protein
MTFPSYQNHTPTRVIEPERDENGREVHVMGSREPARPIASPTAVAELWANDQIDRGAWVQMYTAIVAQALAAPGEELDLQRCADVADLAYFHFHLKANPKLRRG